MSQIKDSFDANELSELAEEIRKDLLTEPSVTNNNSSPQETFSEKELTDLAMSSPQESFSEKELTDLANEIVNDPLFTELCSKSSDHSLNMADFIEEPPKFPQLYAKSHPLPLAMHLDCIPDNDTIIRHPYKLTKSKTDIRSKHIKSSLSTTLHSAAQQLRKSSSFTQRMQSRIDSRACLTPTPKSRKGKTKRKSRKSNTKRRSRAKSFIVPPPAQLLKSRSNSMISANKIADIFTNKANKVWKLKDIVRYMLSDDFETADTFRNALILCHDSFITSVHLFQELRRVFRMSESEMKYTIFHFEDIKQNKSGKDQQQFIQRKIAECIGHWIREYWTEDFAAKHELQNEISLFKSDIQQNEGVFSEKLFDSLVDSLAFVANKFSESNGEREMEKETTYSPAVRSSVAAQNFLKCFHSAEREKRLKSVESRFPALIQLHITSVESFRLMEMDCIEIAAQMTLLDSYMFRAVKQRECLGQNWKKKDKVLKSPNILKMIAQFNDVSKWVQYTILSVHTPRKRKRYIKRMIAMATYFMQNGNLSSLCAFHSALASKNIVSLHASWKLLSKSKMKEWEGIKQLFGWKMNKFKDMHSNLHSPCVPHIGIILEKLFQIDEIGKICVKANGRERIDSIDGRVDCTQIMNLYEQIDHLQCLQSEEYKTEPNFLIQRLIISGFKKSSQISDKMLYKLAKNVADSEKH